MQNDFYVDDGLTSVETEEEAIQLIHDAQSMCASGGVRQHKFVSNNKNVINSVAESERAVDVKVLDLSNERLPIEQALGIKWNVKDYFRCILLQSCWPEYISYTAKYAFHRGINI